MQTRGLIRSPVLQLLAMLCCAGPAIAAEIHDSVPLSLVKAIMANPLGEDTHLYNGIPDAFPRISIPSGFDVLGGMSQGPRTRLILQTSREGETAMDLLKSSFLNDGFMDVNTILGSQSGGFVTPVGMRASHLFCRDDVGALNVTFFAQPEGNIVSLATNPLNGMGGSTCSDIGQPRPSLLGGPASGGARGMMAEMAEYMPVMNLPANSSQAPTAFLGGGGISSSNGTYETRREFQSDMSVPDLYRFFAEQIVGQGWILDSEASGQISASGNWYRTPESDVFLHGGFDIVQTSESSFGIRFRLTRLNVSQ